MEMRLFLRTKDETQQPEEPIQAGSELNFGYKLYWSQLPPVRSDLARVDATRTGIGGFPEGWAPGEHFPETWCRRFAVDFTYKDENPRGFGLLQLDHDFKNYQDVIGWYDKRPSLWVEPTGKWGKGAINLMEIPTTGETLDNVVCFCLYTRKAIRQLGIAPMTSMFSCGTNERRMCNTYHPQIHDSDRLAMWSGSGEWIARPLNNPQRLQFNVRGVAVNTFSNGQEEFPDFTAFWFETPKADDTTFVVYALLDGASLTGAYKFTIHCEEKRVVMEVENRIHFRPELFKYHDAGVDTQQLAGKNDLGFAGFRAFKKPELARRDIVSFLGASYFRAVDETYQYGLSVAPGALPDTLATLTPQAYNEIQYDAQHSLWNNVADRELDVQFFHVGMGFKRRIRMFSVDAASREARANSGMNRRKFVKASVALSALSGMTGLSSLFAQSAWADDGIADGKAVRFDFDVLKQKAAALAKKPWGVRSVKT
ncbi:hypothetical protein CRX72_23000 [Pantoea sp. BRM17]|nr:hypothetical protein CRX72_23000 [Pantoea sp. BRM17]